MDTKLFEKYLEEEKIEEATALLKQYLTEPLTEVEQGALYAAFAMAYMKVKNEVNTEYLAQLKEIENLLKTVQKTERKIDDAMGLEQIREQLK